MSVGLSRAAEVVWAKSRRDDDGWLPLWRHLDDTAGVVGRLWDEWLPSGLRSLVNRALPEGDGRELARWLGGVHDIGKATPAFAMQVRTLADAMRDQGLDMDYGDPDRRLVPHATAGQIVLEDWLREECGFARREARQFAVVVGGHHGVPPTSSDLNTARDHRRLLGYAPAQQRWWDVQRELLSWAAGRFEAADRLAGWQRAAVPQTVQALLTGIVIVADWIASNDELFPYDLADVPRVERAWKDLDLPAPWHAMSSTMSAEELFRARFALPGGAVPYPVQRDAIALAQGVPDPGLLIIEAPMGEGKTEAALGAAEVLAARSGAGGVFVALPTRATSDAMFGRVLSWLERVPDADRARGAHAVALAHGKARLNEDFQSLLKRGRSVAVDLDGETHRQELAAHQWLLGRKKTMLSSFVIGTIDQLLFGALKSRHLVLRHLGLAGKIVIIDEAHAYDVYMGVYLDMVLEWLGGYGVPVIVLSATLPADRRKALVQAYDHGRDRRGRRATPKAKPWQTTPEPEARQYAELDGDIGYPVLVASGGARPPSVQLTEPAGRTAEISLERLDDDLNTLADRLRGELSDGGCALVIRNTVARVQATAEHLAEIFGRKHVTVAHSRFLAPDRAANDEDLRNRFGPPEKAADRPQFHIVVASQVAEQSLDIDFDLLVTDLAPVDLVLQRMGRLHRHDRGDRRPIGLRAPRCLLTGVDWTRDVPEPVNGSIRVYGRYALLRSLAVLRPYQDNPITLPHDIAPLVQVAYSEEPVGPADWQQAMTAARAQFEQLQGRKQQQARTFRLAAPTDGSLVGWLHAGAGDVEDDDSRRGRAMVRDIPAESVEVIVVIRRSDGTLTTPPWLSRDGGRDIPAEAVPSYGLTRTMASCTLGLPYQLCTETALEDIERCGYFPAWQSSRLLEGQLILQLDENGATEIDGFALHYSRWSGLTVTPIE